MRQRLNRSTVGMRHHSAYNTLVQHVHSPDPSGPDDGVQERTSLHAAGSRKRPRGAALAAALVARELSLACHREHGTQTFAVDDIGLANLAQAIKDGVGQFAPFISDLKPPVRIVEHGHVLPGDLVVLWARLDQVDDLVVLQGQRPRDGSGLLPAEDVVNPDTFRLDELR